MIRLAAVIFAALLACGCTRNGLSEPLMSPTVAWNPQHFDGHSYPCPEPRVWPYFHGWNEDGTPDCTTRPPDALYEDVDTGAEP